MYWYDHQDVDQFVKHLFRNGVLPMLGVYIWNLLQTSFNWKTAVKAGIGEGLAQASRVQYGLIDAEKLDFGPCPDCRDREKLILRLEELRIDNDKGKGKGSA